MPYTNDSYNHSAGGTLNKSWEIKIPPNSKLQLFTWQSNAPYGNWSVYGMVGHSLGGVTGPQFYSYRLLNGAGGQIQEMKANQVLNDIEISDGRITILFSYPSNAIAWWTLWYSKK